MTTIEFKKFHDYLVNNILELKQEMETPVEDPVTHEIIEDAKIQEMDMSFYDNSGDYYTEVEKMKYIDGVPIDKRVLVNIINDGAIQDSSVAIEAYVQIITIDILALEEYRSDMMTLFTQFCANNKSSIFSLDSSTCQLSIDNFPKYSEKYEVNGYEKFNTSFTMNIIVLPGAVLSNEYEISINGEKIKYNQVLLDRTTEFTNDLKKQSEIKVFPNTSTFQVVLSGLFVDNSDSNTHVINDMLLDCCSNTSFGKTYSLLLNKKNTIIINGDAFYAKNINFTLAYGTIISWKATFFRAI